MEINYDIIIKYLANNTSENNVFNNKKHILTYSDKFPTKFMEILQNKFYKYGITSMDDKNINISFYTSLLTLLNKKFISFTSDEEINYINNFKNFINEKIKTFIPSDSLKLYLEKNKLQKKDLSNNIDIYYIQTIVEILDINILILDFLNTEFFIVYPDSECNPWKPTLILANYNNLWEPIIFDLKSKRTFNMNDLYLKKILYETDIKYYNSKLINKNFILNDNLKDIVNKIIPSDNIEILDTFVKINTKTYDTTTLNKITKNELSDICKTKNIKINTKMIKKELIDLILNN